MALDADHELPEAIATVRQQVAQLRADLDMMSRQVEEAGRRFSELIALQKSENEAVARIAAPSGAQLLSDAIVLQGRPSQRVRVRRLTIGNSIELPFARYLGVTRCVTTAVDVRTLWDRLLAFEHASDDTLRGFPPSLLDVPGGTIAAAGSGELRVEPFPLADAGARDRSAALERISTLAVPRFAYHYAARKVRNFGHWLLDCVPQIVAMRTIAPDAVFLVPEPVRGFHRSTLALVGLEAGQIREWSGAPISGDRVLVMERDGRAGGGRPLSSLIAMRRLIGADATEHPPRGGRRIFVSRNDARAKRQWIANEAAVEQLFRDRGFEIVSMAGTALDEQREMFAGACVVAGSSGAGLADIVFARAGTHVIVLVSDSLIRWYAEEVGTRSLWSGVERGRGKELAALGDSPRFYAHLAAAFGQVCHTFVGPDDMPISELSSFIDAALEQVRIS